MQTPTYSHTQKAILLPIILTISAILNTFIAIEKYNENRYWLVFIVLLLFLVILMLLTSSLTIRDSGNNLQVFFGPIPILIKSIPYAEIVAVELDHSRIFSFWGFGSWRTGYLWNNGTIDCVKISFSKESYLIGTDDPEGLCAFLKTKITRIET